MWLYDVSVFSENTARRMSEHGFSLTCIFRYKDRIVVSIIIRANTGQRKSVFWYTCAVNAKLGLENPINNDVTGKWIKLF